jgi:hypothetical protein
MENINKENPRYEMAVERVKKSKISILDYLFLQLYSE